jgi:hypothetical protein
MSMEAPQNPDLMFLVGVAIIISIALAIIIPVIS